MSPTTLNSPTGKRYLPLYLQSGYHGKWFGETKYTEGTEANPFVAPRSTTQRHNLRRQLILETHPEVRELMGSEPLTLLVVLINTAAILSSVYLIRNQSIPVMLFWGYFYFGTLAHTQVLLIHELSHNLGHRLPWVNHLFLMIANLPIMYPMAESFRKYHLIHHRHISELSRDTDIPLSFEAKMVKTPVTKALWITLQPLIYGLRSLLFKSTTLTTFEMINALVTYAFALFWIHVLDSRGAVICFHLLGVLLSLGLHPLAAHFLHEHFLFGDHLTNADHPHQLTFSNYGFLGNVFGFNVGYHNEHHDLTTIPWTRLPTLHNIAAQFYAPLPHWNTWIGVFKAWITDARVTGFSRLVDRYPAEGGDRRDDHLVPLAPEGSGPLAPKTRGTNSSRPHCFPPVASFSLRD